MGKAREFFWFDEEHDAPGRFAVLIVVEREGTVAGEPARRGGDVRLLRCLAPVVPGVS